MPTAPLPPKIQFAAGMLVFFGVASLLFAVADAMLARPLGTIDGFHAEGGYLEGKGSDGYAFKYYQKGTGPGAERALQRSVGALAGIGFLAFGVRLFLGSAVMVLTAATLAFLVGLGKGFASAQLARNGQATVGLLGMGLAFFLLVAACLLVAGRAEHVAWRKANAIPPRKTGQAATIAGVLLLLYGIACVGLSTYRVGGWLKPVRGQPGTLGLRAEVTAGTTIEGLGERMKSAAEKAGSFAPGPGFFVQPQAVGVAWGGVWAAAGVGLLIGRSPSPRFVGILALMAAGAVAAIASLCLVSAIPLYAAMPDGLFPGCLVLIIPGIMLLVAKDASAKRG